MKTFESYLKQFPHYTPAAFEAVLPFLSIENIKAGDYFLRQGNVCKSIALVKEGLLRLYYLNDGKEVTNCFCKENTITTSYSSFVTQKESEISIQAVEDSKLIVLPYDSLQSLYKTHLFWQQVGRLAAENEFITTECHNRFLSDLTATERYNQILKSDSELLQRAPLTYLASYMQVAPETLSRIRKQVSRT